MAQRLLQAVKAQGMPHQFSPASNVVTISLGLATRVGEQAQGSAVALLALADAQLYAAKHGGRAQVRGAVLELGAAPPPPAGG